jgi:hypothetical protein
MNGKLSAPVAEQIEEHLCSCDLCTQTLVAAMDPALFEHSEPAAQFFPTVQRRVLQAIEQPPSFRNRAWWTFLRERIGGAVRMAADWLHPGPSEYAYVRGSTRVISQNLVVLEKEFKDITLEIELEKTDTQVTDIKIYTKNPRSGNPLDGLRIDLYANGVEIASCVTERGEALFEQLEFGEYRLRVMEKQKNRGEVSLIIKE